MAILVILVLAVLWAAVLLPPILRSRSQSNASPSGIGDFVSRLRTGLGANRAQDSGLPSLQPIMGPMSPIGGPTGPMGPGVPGLGGGSAPGGPVRVPGGMSPTQRRRRDVLVGLLAAVGVTLMMAMFAGSAMFWVLQLLADALLAGYCYLLVQYKARRGEQSPRARPVAAPALASVQYGSNVARFPGPSHVNAPHDAKVLALRRAVSS